MPAPNQPADLTPDKIKDAAFALAQLRWRTLGADPQRWIEPEQQRELADAFLRYHAAKLAVEATAQKAA